MPAWLRSQARRRTGGRCRRESEPGCVGEGVGQLVALLAGVAANMLQPQVLPRCRFPNKVDQVAQLDAGVRPGGGGEDGAAVGAHRAARRGVQARQCERVDFGRVCRGGAGGTEEQARSVREDDAAAGLTVRHRPVRVGSLERRLVGGAGCNDGCAEGFL